ncbi:MAG: sugar ABC transporter ATP-binding protein [Oscillospiraceae bacterium]|nr:sugar ABC transporter ATP-binding protein [Oscillospiraceae bacterium]
MQPTILKMNKITKIFPGVVALDCVELEVAEGEIHGLVGENGAGKSTLMNVLGGVYTYGSYTGDIVLSGEVCKFRSIRDSESRGIAFIHQELALSPYLSVAENIFLNHEVTNIGSIIDWRETNRRAQEFLKKVGLSEDPQAIVGGLSVGKQQLIEIAKALSKDCKLLILDEPTAALNDEESKNLLNLLITLKKEQGLTSILISHKLSELNGIVDRVTVIRDGKTIETLTAAEMTEDRIIKDMVGREIIDRYPKRDVVPGAIFLEVKNLNAYHPNNIDRKIINNVNFNIRKGEIVGFAGLMGAGRTEIAMAVFGKSYGQKVSGEVYLNGELVNTNSVRRAIESGIAYLTEDRKGQGLSLVHSVRQNMTIVNLSKFVKHSLISGDHEISEAEKMKQTFNIKCHSLEQIVGTLSGGNMQKVSLAKWIMTNADVIILDEPTRGIDVGAKYEIYQIMNRLVSEGKAILFISSDLPEILSMSDRVYVVNEGEIAGELQKSEISQESVMKCIMNHMNRSEKNSGRNTAAS